MLSTLTATLLPLAALVSGVVADSNISSSQIWHDRYHGLLSMASYGDYKTTCPNQTFTAASLAKAFPGNREKPFDVIQEWGPTRTGNSGFIVIVPEMDKLVVVFGNLYGWENLDATPIPINDALNIGEGCRNQTCMAHASAVKAYLEAKDLTNDWAIAKQAVEASGHQWSVTGHAFGGMVALIASLDLGYRNLAHWSHVLGTPCGLNSAAANLYNELYQGEAGQRTVYGNDAVVNFYPESVNCSHTLQGVHIYGVNSTFGVNYEICTETGDPKCLGGNVLEDNRFYYTPLGQCGVPNVVNVTLEDAVVAAEAAAYAKKHHNTSIATAPVGVSTTSSELPTTTPDSSTTSPTTSPNTSGPSATGPSATGPSATTPPPSTGTSINAFSTAANSASRSSSTSGMTVMPSLMGLLSVAFALLA